MENVKLKMTVVAAAQPVLPVVHYVGDDGGEEAEQHDRRAGIHDRVQELPRVRGERQHLLQILQHKEREEK